MAGGKPASTSAKPGPSTCGSCQAFVLRYRPKDEAARDRMRAAGMDFTIGACHLNPQTIEKQTGDFCLQFRRKE